MPINASPRYYAAELKYRKARSIEEKIEALKEMIREAPKHKGAENLLAQLRKRLAKLQAELERKSKKQASRFQEFSVAREAPLVVAIIGKTNSGKSALLNKLTGTHEKVSEFPFTTSKPVQGMIEWKGIKIQLVELPALVQDTIFQEKGPALFSVARICDLLMAVLDGTQPLEEQREFILEELKKANLGNKPILWIINKADLTKLSIDKKNELAVSALTEFNLDKIASKLWGLSNLMLIYLKKPKAKPEPFALEKKSTVRDLIEEVNESWLKKFKYARIWGKSVKFPGQQVGLEHVLAEGDQVELKLEK